MSGVAPPAAPVGGTTLTSRSGVVASFDVDRGTGVVEESSGERHPFHCTAIADGTRRIDEGTKVRFSLAAYHLGGFEAVDLTAAPVAG